MKSFISLLIIITALISPVATLAQLKLPSIFTDNMVLQQQSDVALWGWAKSDADITVQSSWNKKKYTVKADLSGKWRLKISTPTYGGPYELIISDGTTPITLNNILIGEVWLCGGQSNMEMLMQGTSWAKPVSGFNEAILKSTNKNIRLYTVPRSSTTTAQENILPAQWQEANPESVKKFSATAYYFGKRLNETLNNVPIGLISDNYGGSFVQQWMSAETMKAFPEKIMDLSDKNEVTPSTLYNSMLHPIIGYGIKGCIFYQGESNYNKSFQYEKLFPAMVKQWRSEWNIGDFPFYYVQIAPYNYKTFPNNKGTEYFNSAHLRDAQRKSLDIIPNSGMAVLIDAGEEKDIHPVRKDIPGNRLANIALSKTYKIRGIGYASPLYDNIKVKDTLITVYFKNASKGLTSFGKELANFEIAGSDKIFYPAKAVIAKGKTVQVSSPKVQQPVAIRYAFKDIVNGDLYSVDSLPASSFRTDNW